jgi:hypothetical protein
MSDRHAVIVNDDDGLQAVVCTSCERANAFRDAYEALGGETVGIVPVVAAVGLIPSSKQVAQ